VARAWTEPGALGATGSRLTGGPRPYSSPRRGARGLRRVWPLKVLADASATTVAVVAGLSLVARIWPTRSWQIQADQAALFVPAFLTAFAMHGLYRRDHRLVPSVLSDGSAVAKASATGIILSLAIDSALGGLHRRSLDVTQAVSIGLMAVALVPIGRYVVIRKIFGGAGYARRVIIAGSGRVAAIIASRLNRCGVEVTGMVDDDPPADSEVLGRLQDLPRLCVDHDVRHVVVCFSRTAADRLVGLLREAGTDLRICIVPRFYELLNWRLGIEEVQGVPLIHAASPQMSQAARRVKRAVDIIGSATLLALLSPVLLLIAVIIKLTSPGPVLFRQLRAGVGGRPFTMLKFRTMVTDADAQKWQLQAHNEADGPIFKIRADPRVTRVGRVLRRTSLDELPQLLNVVRGEMSLVGPRPFPVDESARIGDSARRRFDVPPGMTGLWQVSGRSDLNYDDLCHLDLLYVSAWSLWWDFRIMLQTPASVFARRGAF
jgi:exopolysaccharide biosynthesis polyprenyl glycosylphosphotransferase